MLRSIPSILVLLLAATPSAATPTTVTLPGYVTEAWDARYAPGDPLQLRIDYFSDFVFWSPGDRWERILQASLRSGDRIGRFAGAWTRADVVCFDVLTGDDLPGFCNPEDPFQAWRLDAAFDASGGPLQLLFTGELVWYANDYRDLYVDGAEFIEHIQWGEVELLRDGRRVLRGRIVPEASTALLLGGGLLALGLRRRRSPRRGCIMMCWGWRARCSTPPRS